MSNNNDDKVVLVSINMSTLRWGILFFLLASAIRISAVKKDESFTMEDVDFEIRKLIKQIEDLEASEESEEIRLRKAQEYGMLGIFLQIKDARYHVAGGQSMKFQALDAFKKAIGYLDPEDGRVVRLLVSLNHRMGMLLKMMGLGEEAVKAHKIVYENSIHTYDLCLGLFHQAEALTMIGRVREAIPLYKKVLEIRPDRINTYYQLTRAMRELNEASIDEWEALLKQMKSAFKRWGDVAKPKSDEEAFTYMSQSPDTGIYWAIYETAEKLGHYDVAWKYLLKGHKIEKEKHYPHNKARAQQKTLTIREIFKGGFWPDEPIGIDSMLPVFIVGMMRSGSTLTETMLDAHKNIWGMGEETIFGAESPRLQEILIRFQGQSSSNPEYMQAVQKHGLNIVKRMKDLADFSTKNSSKSGNILRVVDKNLFNFGNIGFIHLVFPNAVIIHTVRDPLDTILSIYKNKLGDQEIEWAHDPEDIVFEYIQYLEIVDHFRKVLPGRVHDLLYEDLVKNPEGKIKEVIKKLGVVWDPNVMNYYKTNRTIQTLSMTQVRHNIYTKSVGGWRKYAKQMQPFIREFNKFIPDMKARNALPFPDRMNWNFDPNFDYGFGEPMDAGKGTKSTEESCSNSDGKVNAVCGQRQSERHKKRKSTNKTKKISKKGKKNVNKVKKPSKKGNRQK